MKKSEKKRLSLSRALAQANRIQIQNQISLIKGIQ